MILWTLYLFSIIENTNYKNVENQNDAELLLDIFTHLELYFQNNDNKNLLKYYFNSAIINEIKFQKCNHSSNKKEY